MDTPLPAEFDMYQYEAGEFAYDAYMKYFAEGGPAPLEFRDLPASVQKAWAFMACEFKARFTCAG